MATVNEAIRDRTRQHQIRLESYKDGEVRRILKLLDKSERDIIAKLKARGIRIAGRPFDPGAASTQRLEALLQAIRESNTAAMRRISEQIQGDLRELAKHETAWAANTITNSFPEAAAIEAVQPNIAQVAAAAIATPFQGKLLKDWVKDLDRASYTRLKEAIQIGVVEGETIPQIVRRIVGTRANRYSDGILTWTRRSATALVRTAVNHINTQATNAVFQANADLIKGVRWDSVLDSRTTPICQARDGKVYPVNSGPRPPAHINCRSSIVAITKTWRELGVNIDEADAQTRASMNGQVPAELTYGLWLKGQPRSFVEEVLGAKKARLFLDGKLPIERFVNRAGIPLTLAQLARLESAAWTRAGLGTRPARRPVPDTERPAPVTPPAAAVRQQAPAPAPTPAPGPTTPLSGPITADDFSFMIRPPSRAEIELWNRTLPGVRPRDVMNAYTASLPQDIRDAVVVNFRFAPDSVYFPINFTAESRIKNRTVLMSRYLSALSDGNRRATHAMLQMSERIQGGNITKGLMRDAIAFYEKIGVSIIDVHANINVGGYSWAKYGFTPDEDSWASLRGVISRKAGFLQEDLPDHIERAIAAALNKGPEGIWDISDLAYEVQVTPTSRQKLGKYLLLDTDWEGSFNMNNAAQRRRMRDYAGG